jgi:hypothetical protein
LLSRRGSREEAVDPLVGVALLPVALLALAGLVRAARVPTDEYHPDERADFNEGTRRFL